jgi:putative transposase
VIGKYYRCHRAAEFPEFLKQIDTRVPEGLDIHHGQLRHAQNGCDQNLAGGAAILPVHFMPTSASWISQIDWFAELILEADSSRRPYLDEAVPNRYPRLHQAAQWKSKAYRLTNSANEILASVKRFCQRANFMPRILDSYA